ncbi:MAG: bifunctional oligoribonuclease/PAP phosphatase NrnA [Candidatus Auribacterota bacterium]|nr:bifunctional oligoribonuclease/PAP phosphatase NrnA [Candidatus Auribacterota bacterium]
MKEAAEAIRNAGSIVITSHIKPDGDAIGSTLALLRAIKDMGKNCRAISPSHVPYGFLFMLEYEDEIARYQPERDNRVIEEADLLIILDCSDLSRAGQVGVKMAGTGTPILVIDHHSTNESFGTCNYIIHEASSTGALVMNVLDELALPLTLPIAIPLYIAIVTDTGDFNYPSTTPKTHEKAARLLRAGVKPYEIYRTISLDRTVDFIRLAGLAIFNVQFAHDQEIAFSVIGYDLYRKFTPRIDELVMLPPYLISIRGVEVGVLFLEFEPGHILVDLRSQGLINVAKLARKLGGGGHSGAAGVRIRGEMSDIVQQIIHSAGERLDRAHRKGADEARRHKILGRT